MIVLDYTILYQVILTVLLWLVLSKLVFQPYLKMFEQREQKTLGATHEAANLEREGARLKAEYEERIAQAQESGRVAKEAILQAAREQRDQILSAARDEASAVLERVREDIRRQLESERRAVAANAAAVAQSMASRILGRNVT